jgi:hypothetical protein|tara:strand:+ start:1754 stop:2971 length:1218 start_codon:yes stop_codon:yes gene_type:complete
MPKIQQGLNSLINSSSPISQAQQIAPVRVKFVSLNGQEEPVNWAKYGKFLGVGGILFEELNNPGGAPLDSLSWAAPLHSNLKTLPVLNEVVYIISLPNPSVQNDLNSGFQYYYFQSVNIWNSVHHNAIPNSLKDQPSNAENYEKTESGLQVQSTEQDSINLGKTFKEREVRNLQPFEGDVLLEGRWGNTIRFGSTVNNSSPSNSWSDNGEDGEPITIIKNGQTKTDDDSWVPQVENINTDKSSIYLTSDQKIPIEGASISYKSYDTPPENINEYIGEQVLINSGRLLFNAKNESILLSANNSINLNTQDTVNIDSKNKFIVDTREIYLGSKDATEPVILGDKFLDDFQKLLQQTISLTTALTTVGTPIPFVPNIAVAQTATKVGLQAQSMLSSITYYKSKTTKTL